MDEVTEHLGPAMRALTERQREFVRLVLDNPIAPKWRLAKRAGFGEVASSEGYLRLHAHRLMHSDRVLAAFDEETQKAVRLGGALGIAGLLRLAGNPKASGHLRACEALADRAGFSAVQRMDVKHEHVDLTGDAVRKEIERLAAKVGVDPVKLLGGNVLEGEFTEVKE